MRLPEITFGQDYRTIQDALPELAFSPSDPSGFADCGYNKGAITEMRDLAMHALHQVSSACPVSMQKSVADRFSHIQMFAVPFPKANREKASAAMIINRPDVATWKAGNRVPLGVNASLCIGASSQNFKDDAQAVLSSLTHEAAHLFGSAAFRAQPSCDELFAIAMQRHFFPTPVGEDLRFSTDALPQHIRGTSGVALDDNAGMPGSAVYQLALRTSAAHAVPERFPDVLRVADALTMDASQSGVYSGLEDMRAAFKGIIPEPNNALDSMVLRRLEPGMAHFLLPFRRRLLFLMSEVRRNPRYGVPGVHNQFEFTDMRATVTVLAHIKGQSQPTSFQWNAHSTSMLSFDSIAQMLETQLGIPRDTLETLSMDIPGFTSVTMQKDTMTVT